MQDSITVATKCSLSFKMNQRANKDEPGVFGRPFEFGSHIAAASLGRMKLPPPIKCDCDLHTTV